MQSGSWEIEKSLLSFFPIKIFKAIYSKNNIYNMHSFPKLLS